MILPLFVALDRIDPALREASKDLGSGRIRTFLQVTLPLAMPGVVAGLLLVFIPLSGDYITASVLGGLQGNMVGALVASQFQAAQNWARGSAMAMLLIGMVLAAIALVAVVGVDGQGHRPAPTPDRHRRRGSPGAPPDVDAASVGGGGRCGRGRARPRRPGGRAGNGPAGRARGASTAPAPPVRRLVDRAGGVVGVRLRIPLPADHLHRHLLVQRRLGSAGRLGRVEHAVVPGVLEQRAADAVDQALAHCRRRLHDPRCGDRRPGGRGPGSAPRAGGASRSSPSSSSCS